MFVILLRLFHEADAHALNPILLTQSDILHDLVLLLFEKHVVGAAGIGSAATIIAHFTT